jgi:hypothetical protein
MSPALRRSVYLYEKSHATKTTPALKLHSPRLNRKTLPTSRESIIEAAEREGYRLGFQDLHTTAANYRTGDEWIAWYRGWKAGQKERPRE